MAEWVIHGHLNVCNSDKHELFDGVRRGLYFVYVVILYDIYWFHAET